MQLQQLTRRSVIKVIFFGNYFYGLCIVALSVEAGLQQQYPLNSLSYYVLAFIATVLYYTKAYVPSKAVNSLNPRTRWYARNRKEILLSQWVLTVVLVVLSAVYLYRHMEGFIKMPLLNWILLAAFPILALLYYGIDQRFFGSYSLRSIGWLKPFVIGLIWAGTATVYPVLFNGVERQSDYYEVTMVGSFLFIKNFMFISVLCIMFDIKDYAADHNKRIKTFVVKVGLRKTIFYIILPLSALGLASFLVVALLRGFSDMMILINLIPFISLLIVAYSMHRRQSIFYYLAIIDGLMLLKGICGSVAMSFFYF